ncbi:MAG: hypothetical protein ACRCVJ_05765 [Clostridium sp.]|uniref:hypothetical protein n=1 Tax=Clostridium sp. TaxID=1506 RepID=UPI003F3D4EFE
MINLIKADLYRLFRSKIYRNCIIASIIVSLIVIILSITTDAEIFIFSFTNPEGVTRGFKLGIETGDDYIKFLVNALSAAALIYIIGITLTSSSVVNKIKSGIYKNTVSYGYERYKVYISNLVAIIIGLSIIITASFLGILLVTSVICKPINLSYESILITIKTLTLYIIILSSMVSIYTFLATLIPNSEVISIIAMVEIIGITMIGMMLSDNLNKFIPYSMIIELGSNPKSNNFLTYIINGLIIITISTLFGVAVFKRREIK